MWLYIIAGIGLLAIFLVIKSFVWDKPHDLILSLKSDIEKLQSIHQQELISITEKLRSNTYSSGQTSEIVDIILTTAWRELSELCNKQFSFLGIPKQYDTSVWEKNSVIEPMKRRFIEAIEEQYKYRYLIFLFPELAKLFNGREIVRVPSEHPTTIDVRTENLFDVVNLLQRTSKASAELIYLKNRIAFLKASNSNLKAIPYMAGIMADYETYGLERLAKELDWGYEIKRMGKVKSIREIRKDAQAMVERNKESQYQLAYLLNLFPNLEDVVDTDYFHLPLIEVSELSEYDFARDYLSKEEYETLSITERNQRALDYYKNSKKKTKWQIGRDYELYVGYRYSQDGYDVDYFGSYMGLEDLGRDLIVKKDGTTSIIQCKYWSSTKQIHEKHVNQLFGTKVCFCIEHSIEPDKVKGVLVTNIQLSETAKKMASYLGIEYTENFEAGDYPCIKCNIGKDELGVVKIYHLPFDQQYDSAKIKNEGEFFAMTVAEAEAAGFRRAFRWFGNN